MASVSVCCNVRPARSIKLGFHQISSSLPDSSSLSLHSASIFRFKNGAKLVTKKRLHLVHASNKLSQEPIKKGEAITSSNTSTAQGPPFLTILAGIVVFALVIWVVGSIVTWLFGLFGLIFSK